MLEKLNLLISHRYFRRICFYILLLLMTTLTINDLRILIIQYCDDNRQAKIDIIFNDTVTFPNMTFCMAKKHAWSHFAINMTNETEWNLIIQDGLKNYTDKKSFLTHHWNYRMVVEAYQVISNLNSMERETTDIGAMRSIYSFRLSPHLAQMRKMIAFWLNEIDKRNVTFSEFQQKVGIETLKRSLQRFQRLSFNPDDIFHTRIKITWLSLLQLCFQPEFDKNNFKDIEEQGEFFTLQLLHNSKNLDNEFVDCMSLDFHGRPTDLARNMEGKGRIQDGVASELCLGQLHDIEIEIKAKYISLPRKPKNNNNNDVDNDDNDNGAICRNYDENEDNEFDCKSRCRMEMLQRICNCTPLTLSYLASSETLKKFPHCAYENCIINIENITIKNFVDENCGKNCISNCVQVRYSVNSFNKGKASRPDLTEVTTYWISFEYLQMEQEFVWTPVTFFAGLGGALGLWLGLSILSFIQFLIFLSAQLSKQISKKKITPTNNIPMNDKVSGYTTGYLQQRFPVNKTNKSLKNA